MADSIGRIFFPGAYTAGDAVRRNKEERSREFIQYLPKFASMGFQPEEINAMGRKYIESGQFDIPTERTKMLPPEDGVDVPSRSTRVPIQFAEPETVVYNPYTNEQVKIQGKNVKTVGQPAKPPEADVPVNVYDEETGKMKTVGTAPKNAKVITTRKSKASEPRTAKEFQDEVARDVLKNYFTLEATGGDTSKIESSAISAAKRFGMSIEQIKNEPGFWGKLFGQDGESVEKPGFTPPGTRASANPHGNPGVQAKAQKWLEDRGAKVTPANIEAVIKAGKVK